ncbi:MULTISPECIES: restriction endonuclease subunit S [Acinetobacter]|uniref:restriction endonuclease subunit S n=1 Tax=Acinetobacter TaxID=469 RepID=UPI0015D3F7E7|nr:MULTISPECIES: restriction endonuclease subunit S [Acinetobacter]MDH2577744.1 restriction endonuclease subunit S [Acinetobacter baumannii]
MVNDWSLSTLDEAGIILIDCVHETPPDAGIGYPYIAIPQIKNGYIDFSANPRLIKYSDYKKWTIKANPQADDIVLSRRCNPGETAYVPKGVEFALGQNLVLLRSSGEKVYPPFLRWLVRGPEWWAQVSKYLNVGAVFDSLRCAEIPKFELSIPPLHEQKAIADILGSLDAKIELNQDMNKTLEAMAQALFKSWFVNFDPVIDNALAAGNPIPDELFDRAEQRKTIKKNENNRAIRSLFPDELEFNKEMGWIPKGWSITPVYEVADFINGSSFKSQYFSDEKEALPIVKIAEIKNGISEQTKFTTQKMAEKYAINDGDILFSWSGNPDTSIDTFIWTGGKGWLNQHIFNVVLHKDSDKTFVYYLLKYLKPIFTEIARDKQTTGLGHVTVKDMKRIYTIKPPVEVLEAFGLYSDSIFEKWYQNLFSSKELAKLRDTLLPKLISGEIRIPEAEPLVEDV